MKKCNHWKKQCLGVDWSSKSAQNNWCQMGVQTKLNENGKVDKYKELLVARGYK